MIGKGPPKHLKLRRAQQAHVPSSYVDKLEGIVAYCRLLIGAGCLLGLVAFGQLEGPSGHL